MTPFIITILIVKKRNQCFFEPDCNITSCCLDIDIDNTGYREITDAYETHLFKTTFCE